MSKHRILISACLLGEKVRYDGDSMQLDHVTIKNWQESSLLLPICPEVSGGLSTPRKPAEIMPHNNELVKIVNMENIDVTEEFNRGAQAALEICQQHNIKLAILTESSPSCGSSFIHNGKFDGQKVAGEGITTRLLRKSDIKVFNQFQVEQALEYYQSLTKSEKIIS